MLSLVEEKEEEEEEEEEEEICKPGCTFIIYMVKKTPKPNLKQILWKMTKLVLKLVEEEEEEEEEEDEDEEICTSCFQIKDVQTLFHTYPPYSLNG